MLNDLHIIVKTYVPKDRLVVIRMSTEYGFKCDVSTIKYSKESAIKFIHDYEIGLIDKVDSEAKVFYRGRNEIHRICELKRQAVREQLAFELSKKDNKNRDFCIDISSILEYDCIEGWIVKCI